MKSMLDMECQTSQTYRDVLVNGSDTGGQGA